MANVTSRSFQSGCNRGNVLVLLKNDLMKTFWGLKFPKLPTLSEDIQRTLIKTIPIYWMLEYVVQKLAYDCIVFGISFV